MGLVGAATAHAVRCGMGKIKQARVLLRNHFLKICVDFRWRIALVAANVQGNGWMIPDTLDITGCNLIEALRVGGVRAVPGICQPEVLPYHYSIAVTGFVEGFVVRHSNPVTDHSEVH